MIKVLGSRSTLYFSTYSTARNYLTLTEYVLPCLGLFLYYHVQVWFLRVGPPPLRTRLEDGSRLTFSYISFFSFTFPGAPYRIFLLFLPCYFYLVIEQHTFPFPSILYEYRVQALFPWIVVPRYQNIFLPYLHWTFPRELSADPPPQKEPLLYEKMVNIHSTWAPIKDKFSFVYGDGKHISIHYCTCCFEQGRG